MIHCLNIEFTKTYKNVDNAKRAANKLKNLPGNLRYTIVPVEQEDGTNRYGVLFIGQDAIHAGVHFHFNVIA